MKCPLLPRLAMLLVCAALAGPAGAAVDKLLKPGTATKTKDDTAAVQMGEYHGVKHAIGVLPFENNGGFFSGMSLESKISDMLESSLAATGRFVMVERTELNSVISEQDLQSSGRASKSSDVAQTGKIRSARYLATGTITEASADTSGEGGGVNIRGFKLGGSSKKAAVVIVVKLVDSTTSEVVASQRIRGEAGSSALNVGYSGRNFGGDLGAFARTPIGEAVQNCVDQAVRFIATNMEEFPVEGTIVSVSETNIIINLGENYGIKAGQAFVVRKRGEVLIDPGTGEILDREEGEITATIEVSKVREKVSYCTLANGALPERGDTVVLQ